MPRNEAFLIRWDDQYRDTGSVGFNPAGTLRVSLLIDNRARPTAIINNLRTRRGVVLSYAAGKDNAVETAQGCGKRPDFPNNAIDKQCNCLTRPRI